MNTLSVPSADIELRTAKVGDIAGIVAVVATCGPYLSPHMPYLYLIYTRCFSETCCVAELDGKIVGWCAGLRVAESSYFLHQLGVAPEARGKGVAFQLLAHLLGKLRSRHGDAFRLEFTTDRRNGTVHRLNGKVAAAYGMQLCKLPDVVPSLDDGCEEEFYEMVPLRHRHPQLVRPAALDAA